MWKYRYLACRMPGDVSKWAVSVSAQGLAFCGVMGIFWAGVCWGRAQGSAWRYKMRDLRRPRLNICFTWLYRIIRAAGNADLEWFKLGVGRDLHKKAGCDMIIKFITLAELELCEGDESLGWSGVLSVPVPSPRVSRDTFPAACWHSRTYFNTLVKVLLPFHRCWLQTEGGRGLLSVTALYEKSVSAHGS